MDGTANPSSGGSGRRWRHHRGELSATAGAFRCDFAKSLTYACISSLPHVLERNFAWTKVRVLRSVGVLAGSDSHVFGLVLSHVLRCSESAEEEAFCSLFAR